MNPRAIVGLLCLNLAFAFVGLSLLWGIRGWRSWIDAIRLGGLAYFLGVGALVVTLTAELVLGIPYGWPSLLVTTFVVVAIGVVVGRARGRRWAGRPTPSGWSVPSPGVFVALMAAGLVLWLESSFRAARLEPLWLIDAWRVWTIRAKFLLFEGGLGGIDPGTPPGLSLVQAQAFQAMGSVDTVTLHLQHWFFALGYLAAVFGLLAHRVRAAILAPVVLLTLVMPSFSDIAIWPLADPFLAHLAAVGAVLLCLWIEDRARWRLEAAVVLLAAAVLVKREAVLVVACVFLAAAVGSWSRKRGAWPGLALAGVVTLALSASWRLGLILGEGTDAPSSGYLSFASAPGRGLDSVRLVASTYSGSHWGFPLLLALIAIVLSLVARARSTPLFVLTFLCTSLATASFVIWSEPKLGISQDLSASPVIRMTLVVVVVVCPLSALMLEDAWRGGVSTDSAGAGWALFEGGGSLRRVAAWSAVAAAVLVYPLSALLGVGGPTLPGGRPVFPKPPPGPLAHVPNAGAALEGSRRADHAAARRRNTQTPPPWNKAPTPGCARGDRPVPGFVMSRRSRCAPRYLAQSPGRNRTFGGPAKASRGRSLIGPVLRS